MTLSTRLGTLLEHCEKGGALWDLCCDHGYLGLYAAQTGCFSEIILNDCVSELIDKLSSKVILSQTPVRTLCCPAEAIAEVVTGSVCIAGVGGEKIYHILSSLEQSGVLQANCIVVCPEKDAEWLLRQNLRDYSIHLQFQIPHNHTTRWIAVYHRLHAS